MPKININNYQIEDSKPQSKVKMSANKKIRKMRQ